MKYPDIRMPPLRTGNIWIIGSIAKKELKRHGVPQETVREFWQDFVKSDRYIDKLNVVRSWINTED